LLGGTCILLLRTLDPLGPDRLSSVDGRNRPSGRIGRLQIRQPPDLADKTIAANLRD
jgi:hypothetical protein